MFVMVFIEVIEEKKAKFSLWLYNITTKYKNTAGGDISPGRWYITATQQIITGLGLGLQPSGDLAASYLLFK